MLFRKKKFKSKVKPKTNSSSSIDAPKSNQNTRIQPTKSKTEHRQASTPKAEVKCQEPRKEFLKIFHRLTHRSRPWDVWKDFVTMFACSISNTVDKTNYDEREALYMKIIKHYNKQEQMLFPELVAETVMALEINSEQDFLGDIFMELNLGNKATGQMFTPYSVCQCMADITMRDVVSPVNEQGFITINDPCCGAGATLIAGIHEAKKQLEKENLNFQNHILVAAQDVDYTAALMCYIQFSLLGVAGYVKIGDSLTEPMTSDDSMENYWFTPMYFSDVWTMRRILKEL